ncbi:hypothetical protein [Ramlibacter humi]|uniref:DUF59 domain-containing protein n=1 Tax=Ramlibacter humi TaxID=2530451 RepID=A0A4Z0C0G9_9BURK|nr:hypothetical protein [Ramlibacter humi]TFZ03729.1 hypothetical protein EZ216_08705 [Ramlibacter humi]
MATQPSPDPRQDLLRAALLQMLDRHQVPPGWIGADAMAVVGRAGSGLHIRLVVLHWEPVLMPCLPALQDDLEQRLLAMEPDAVAWLRGFSWQFQWPPGLRRPPVPQPAPWVAAASGK